MKRHRLMVLGAGFAVVLTGFVLITLRPESRINKENFNKIEAGQSEAQVERVLGGAARDEFRRPRVLYSEDGLEGVVFTQGDVTPQMLGTSGKVWASDKGIVVVSFDRDGQVMNKVFLPARPRNEGLLDKIRRWFGM